MQIERVTSQTFLGLNRLENIFPLLEYNSAE